MCPGQCKCVQVSVIVNVFRPVLMCPDQCGCVQASVGKKTGYAQASVDVFRPVWMCSDQCGCVQASVDVFRPVWICSDKYECIQVSVDKCSGPQECPCINISQHQLRTDLKRACSTYIN